MNTWGFVLVVAVVLLAGTAVYADSGHDLTEALRPDINYRDRQLQQYRNVNANSGSQCTKSFHYGYAYEFFLGSYIALPDSGWVDWNRFSIALWLKPFSMGQIWTGVIGAFTNHWTNSIPTYLLQVNGGLAYDLGDLRFFAGFWNYSFNGVPPSVPLASGSWHHVVASFDTNEYWIYVNGTLENHGFHEKSGVTVEANRPFHVGRFWDEESDKRFPGNMDEVSVWNRVLSVDEVAALAAGRQLTPATEQSLVLYYTADMDNLTHAIDQSGNARHGKFSYGVPTLTSPLHSLSYVGHVANCIACRDKSFPSCTVRSVGASLCGDGMITGEEECETGASCTADCKCPGAVPHQNMLECLPDYCKYEELVDMLKSSLANCSDCSCMRKVVVTRFLGMGCSINDIPWSALGLLATECQFICSDNCPGLFRDTCKASATKTVCQNITGCFWCGECVAGPWNCPPRCGNGVLDVGEMCDDGGEGRCAKDCSAVVPGWNCTDADHCNSICGDGWVVGTEQCDGTSVGCNATTCKSLVGYQCTTKSDCSTYPGFCISKFMSCRCNSSICLDSTNIGLVVGVPVAFGAACLVVVGLVVIFKVFHLPTPMSIYRKLTSLEDKVLSTREEALACSTLETLNFPMTVDTCPLDFGFTTTQAPIDTDIPQIIELENNASKLYWQLFPPVSEKYRVKCDPAYGVLNAYESVGVEVMINIGCTTVINDDTMLLVVSHAPIINKAFLSHRTIAIQLKSKMTMKLDPDEIETIQPPIGDGSFGTVYRGTYRTQDVAVKLLKVQIAGPEFMQEIQFMETLRSPYVVRFVGAVMIPGKYSMVTEFMPLGNLSSVIGKYTLEYRWKLKACLDCSRGMTFLHKSNIIHRDLKPDNLLVSSLEPTAAVVAKLCDFGTSRETCDEASRNYTKGIGTPIYMAPEVLDHTNANYAKPADVFSFAIMLHHVFTEQEPYTQLGFHHAWDVADYVVSGKRLPIPDNCPKGYRLLMTRCWDHDPANRPSFADAALSLEMALEDLDDQQAP